MAKSKDSRCTLMVSPNDIEQGSSIEVGTPSPFETRRIGVLGRLLRRPLSVISGLFLLCVITATIAAPWLAPYSPDAQNYGALFTGPNSHYLLGTDDLGRDLLSRMMYGGRISLLGVAEALIVYLVLGLPAGLVAGYVGGWFDSLVVWLSDLSFAVPQIVVVLAVLAILGEKSSVAMITLGILGAPGLMRIARGATMAVEREQYIVAARVSGLTRRRTITRHVLPRIAGSIIVQVSLFAGVALIFQTGIDYLGLATQPPTPSWGSMIAEGSQYMANDPWMIIPPGILVALVILAFGLLGDGVRDSYTEVWSSASRGSVKAKRSLRIGSASNVTVSRPPAPPSDSQALLEVRTLSVALRRKDADVSITSEVSFSVNSGEAIGIVGESGCGKTITGHAIIGLLPKGADIIGGEIYYAGQALRDASERQMGLLRGREIAMVSQEPVASLDPAFPVGAQIAEVARTCRGITRTEARKVALELFALVRLPNPAQIYKRYPHELSGGMAQRVGIAAAIAGRPKLLIADEPTTALDVTVQAEILELLHDLRSEMGLALILISHDWGVVADLCDKVIVMYAGQVVERASLSAMLREPRHPYTAALLASDPHKASTGSRLPALAGSVPSIGQWPRGCHLAPRCPLATDQCRNESIDEVEVGEDHLTRCIHHDQLHGVSPRFLGEL